MAPLAAAFQPRPSAGPRTRFRPKCRPATMAFRDWLRPDRTAKGVPGLNHSPAAPEPEEDDDYANAGQPGPDPAINPAFLPILTEQEPQPRQQGRQQQQQPRRPNQTTTSRNNADSDDEPPKSRFWETKLSEIEWVFLNELYPKFPEAWHYLYERAMLRKGLEPTIPPYQPSKPSGPITMPPAA